MRLATNNNGWYLFTSKCIEIAATTDPNWKKEPWPFGFAWPKSHFGPFARRPAIAKETRQKTRAYFAPFLARWFSLSLCQKVNSSSVGAILFSHSSSSSPAGEYHAKIERISMSSGSMLERQFIHEYACVGRRVSAHIKFQIQHWHAAQYFFSFFSLNVANWRCLPENRNILCWLVGLCLLACLSFCL